MKHNNNMKKIMANKYLILIPIIILLIISVITLKQGTSLGTKQLIFCILSLALIFVISKINMKWVIKKSTWFYILCNILLLLVLIIGKETKGAKAWLNLYYFKLQPSELMKIALLLYLIKLNMTNRNIIILIIAFLIPTILTYLEPDTGAIIFYAIILLSCLLYRNKNKKGLIILTILALLTILGFAFMYIKYEDLFIKIFGTSIFYRIDRLIGFKEQSSIQIENALISIGSHNFVYFPEYHNDFIFAYILSTNNIFIPLLILISFFFIFKYLWQKKNPLFTAVLLTLVFQSFYNVLMNIGLVPIIGIPLPFVSYGGSYLLSLCILIGMVINIYNKDNNYMVLHKDSN